MWHWIARRKERAAVQRLSNVIDQLERTADSLEARNNILTGQVPTVGLYETFHVDTGRGLVDVVLYDLELEIDSNGRPKVAGSILDRLQFDGMMSPNKIAGT